MKYNKLKMEKYKDLEIQDLLKSELKEEQNIKKEKEKSKNIDSKSIKKKKINFSKSQKISNLKKFKKKMFIIKYCIPQPIKKTTT